VRHPEFPNEGDVVPLPTALIDFLGGDPNDGVLDIDKPCAPAADTSCYILDDFGRTLVGNSYSNSVDGGAWGAGDVHEGAQSMDGSTLVTSAFAYTDVASAIVGTDVSSYVGTFSWSPLHTPSWADCSGQFTLSGWRGDEAWMEYVVPEHPTDLAGVLIGPLTFTYWNYYGNTVGSDYGANVVVMSSDPTALGQGTVVAHLVDGVATTVYVPSSLIPVEGGVLHVGMVPAWQADFGEYDCGWNWPYNTGVFTSAKSSVNTWTDTLTWQSWDASADAWGSGLDSDVTGAWWYGNLPWVVSASGGTFGINGDSIYLTATTQETLTARMVGSNVYDDGTEEDATSYGEPWNEPLGVNMKARFRITTAGDVTEAGQRYLYFTWNNDRDAFKATVWLGDGNHAEGLTVTDGEATGSIDKAITEGSWMWVRMDTRHADYVRGKMWVEGGVKGSGEPVAWDIIVSRADDAENPISGDFFEIGMSAGNATGAAQTIEVDEVQFCGAGDDCEWVTDRMGQSTGADFLFRTAQAFKEGSLWFFVDGMHVPMRTVDRLVGSFKGFHGVSPDENAILVSRYLVETDT
jgi:hypothetical protein